MAGQLVLRLIVWDDPAEVDDLVDAVLACCAAKLSASLASRSAKFACVSLAVGIMEWTR
ncbi:hypothetical protein [Paenibacillus sp. 22594]|uniref:hypothetical protein n=1 Tax=Paenibacillus sp. 22594 TaxID=3453947 RepID=UPI003F839CA4